MDPNMISAQDALERLREGNRRFASNVRSLDALTSHARRNALAAGQAPFAIILGCSDSRVPPEVIFDEGIGDLFVVRVAGNVSEPATVGSEFGSQVRVTVAAPEVSAKRGKSRMARTMSRFRRAWTRFNCP